MNCSNGGYLGIELDCARPNTTDSFRAWLRENEPLLNIWGRAAAGAQASPCGPFSFNETVFNLPGSGLPARLAHRTYTYLGSFSGTGSDSGQSCCCK
jgi:hypothetical protein